MAKKKGNTGILVGTAVVLGAGAIWYFTKGKSEDTTNDTTTEVDDVTTDTTTDDPVKEKIKQLQREINKVSTKQLDVTGIVDAQTILLYGIYRKRLPLEYQNMLAKTLTESKSIVQNVVKRKPSTTATRTSAAVKKKIAAKNAKKGSSTNKLAFVKKKTTVSKNAKKGSSTNKLAFVKKKTTVSKKTIPAAKRRR